MTISSSMGSGAPTASPLGAPGLISLVVLVAGTLALGAVYGPAQGALFLVGGEVGISV